MPDGPAQGVDDPLVAYASPYAHFSSAENFFSICKRSAIGTYHHMSEAHLGRYCAEFDLRYNTRTLTDAEPTDAAIVGAIGGLTL